MMHKRIFAILILLLMLLSYTSCQRGADNEYASAGQIVSENDHQEEQSKTEKPLMEDKNSNGEKNNDEKAEETGEHEKNELEEKDLEKDVIVRQDGENITELFYPQTGTLKVRGSGEVFQRYCIVHKPSWFSLIKRIIIEEGITSVRCSFEDMDSLESIEFPSSLKDITSSFNRVKGLKELIIQADTKLYIMGSFEDCGIQKLKFEGSFWIESSFNAIEIAQVIIPENSTCAGSFRECQNLKEVVLEKNVRVKEIDDGNHGDADPFDEMVAETLYNFQNGPDKPKIYRYLPNDGAELYCGENSQYLPISVPEGEDWKDYRDMPMELKS